jgi:tetratricopeptide (TPR) repeat protein
MLELNYNALVLRAQSALRNKDVQSARAICEDLLRQRKNDPKVMSILSRVAIEQSRYEEARHLLEKCLLRQPKAIEFHLDLAWLLTRIGKSTAAIARLEKAFRLQPGNPFVVALMAETHERAGEYEKARNLLESHVDSKKETPAMAVVWAKILLHEKNSQDAIAILDRHLTAARLPDDFWHVLGQAHERAGHFDAAFGSYSKANAKTLHQFDLQQFIQRYRSLVKSFDRRTLERLPQPLHSTESAIFIAGRPRSGTTLIEKILDSHPNVTGVGELPHLPPILENLGFEIGSILPYPACIRDLEQQDVDRLSRDYLDHIRRIAPEVARGGRSVDKNLENYQMLGPIAILFPHSHVIHIKREPIDNCWAIFVANMNYSWCSDLRTLGVTQGLYEGIMRHWHHVLKLQILDVEYESIVEDQEVWTRKILEFCELPWDHRCLRFYEESGKQKDSIAAPTLSYSQVRQPIYKTAVGRAKKFEAFLDPLHAGLAEGRKLADEVMSQG